MAHKNEIPNFTNAKPLRPNTGIKIIGNTGLKEQYILNSIENCDIDIAFVSAVKIQNSVVYPKHKQEAKLSLLG